MKLGKVDFKLEELIFVLLLTIFFLFLFVGSFQYRPEARFFPLVLSTPAILLLGLYLFRGFLPDSLSKMMTGVGELTFGTSIPDDFGEEEIPEELTDVKTANVKSYLIFGFTIFYMLFSYLIGFYLSTLIFLVLYLYPTRRKRLGQLVGSFLLIVVLMGGVYVFDIAFGHHFGDGIMLSFP